MKKNQNYEINFATNTIIVSKKFLAAASVMETAAYKEMLELQKLGMPIGVKEIHRGKAKEKKWTFTRMEHYLKNVTESDKWMADYKTLKEATCHPVVWNWFKSTFDILDDKKKNRVPEMNADHKIIVGPWTKASQDNVNAIVASHNEAKEEKKQALIETAPQKIGA